MENKGPYNIVTEKGEVLATCRLKCTALQTLPEYRMFKNEKLKIVEVEKDGESSTNKG